MTLEVKGGVANAALVARLSNSAVGTIANQYYWCDGDCSLFIDIETKQAGGTKVEVVDKTGTLVDGVALRVHAAARIAVDVHGHEAAGDGVFTVKQGEKLEVESTVFDADGAKLAFSHHGVAQVYADKGIVGPDDENRYPRNVRRREGRRQRRRRDDARAPRGRRESVVRVRVTK